MEHIKSLFIKTLSHDELNSEVKELINPKTFTRVDVYRELKQQEVGVEKYWPCETYEFFKQKLFSSWLKEHLCNLKMQEIKESNQLEHLKQLHQSAKQRKKDLAEMNLRNDPGKQSI